MRYALISVFDKTGIENLAKGLIDLGIKIISTGGTAKLLKDNDIEVIDVKDITGFEERFCGRVKTLHPNIFSGILYRRDNKDDLKDIKEMDNVSIDIVINNLYPFEEKLRQTDDEDILTENIDIGGPSMIRAAAKNYKDVYIVTDIADYDKLLENLKQEKNDILYRKKLASKAFSYTAYYDSLISNYFQKALSDFLPENLTLSYKKKDELRYGENPHQRAAFYEKAFIEKNEIAEYKKLHGKELSFNNITDIYSAVRIIKEFSEATAVGIKHNNPCGIASGKSIEEAFDKAYKADTESIFGGIISLNRKLTKNIAERISSIFIEIVIAPSYEKEALEILMKKKNIRIIEMPSIMEFEIEEKHYRQVLNGLLIQESDKDLFTKELIYPTRRKPSEKELEDLLFAWKSCKNINSNAVVIAKDKMTLAIGQGEVKRYWAVEKSINRSVENTKNAVLASDGFFFADTIEALNKAGIKAVIEPGGSIKDNEVIELADKYNIAIVFTSTRHFKH